MSFLRGLVAGMLIAGLQLAAGHLWFEYQRVSFHGDAALAAVVPIVLLPLAIAWGWTWVSDRWSGRSGPRLALYTLALALSTAAAFPLDVFLASAQRPSPAAAVDAVLVGGLFVAPVIALASILYWAYASGRVPASFGTLALGYLGGLLLALVLPTLTMGAVAGTAAGHTWQRPGAKGRISFLVVVLMLVAALELPAVTLPQLLAALPPTR